MATVAEIYGFLDRKAPFSLQMDFDNSGFLVGRGESEVKQVLISLDITEEVISEAAEKNAQLIVSHHPLIFHPTKSVTDLDIVGRRIMGLLKHDIAAICAHTNLDRVSGGVNDALAEALGLRTYEFLQIDGTDQNGKPYGLGRVGVLDQPCELKDYTYSIKSLLGSNGLRYCVGNRTVRKVAVCGGACGDMLPVAYASGCDTFVTADVKYNVFLDAASMGMNLIDAGHFPTENVICPVLSAWLSEQFPELAVLLSQRHSEVTCYL